MLSEQQCVARSQCGCRDARGTFLPVSGDRKWEWGQYTSRMALSPFLYLSFGLGHLCVYAWPWV